MYKYCNNLQNRFNNGDPFKYSIKISGNYSNKKLNKSDQIQFVKYSFTTFYLLFLFGFSYFNCMDISTCMYLAIQTCKEAPCFLRTARSSCVACLSCLVKDIRDP